MAERVSGPRSRRSKKQKKLKSVLIAIVAFLAVIAMVAVVWIAVDRLSKDPGSNPTDLPSDTPTVDEPQPEEDLSVRPVSSATIAVTGDTLIHSNVYNAALQNGVYDFNDIFTFFTPYISKADYAVTNLEVTLRGPDLAYSGYPRFNCPDAITESLKNAGFDLSLTANNHCFDTGRTGLIRTLNVLQEQGLETLGTYKTPEEQKYLIKTVNGISVGMLCYTYETSDAYPDRPSVNGILTSQDSVGQICSFDYNQLNKFYAEVSEYISAMKAAGADATMIFIHWGNEYQLNAAASQKKISQKLCDLGIDVIVGGHPHVIQPTALLHSTVNPYHKTVCIYSTGNMVSNQRRELMGLKTGHTEDGIFFSVTFTKYSNGTVALESADAIPTWVYMHTENGKKIYSILPLDSSVDWKTAFGLNDAAFGYCKESYDRTMALVGGGLKDINHYLEGKTAQRIRAFLHGIPNEIVEQY